MMNNKQIAIAKHNASLKRPADIFTGCLAKGTLKQTHKKLAQSKFAKVKK